MDIVDEKLIPLNGAIRKLTTDVKLRKRLHDNYKYHAKKNGLILKNNKTVRRQLPCPVGDNYLDRLNDM